MAVQRLFALAATLMLVGADARALVCEELRQQIETKIRAAGVAHFSLTAVDASAAVPGRVVGSCDRGARKIVYRQEGRAASDPILTECKDGTASVGGHCGKKP